jgi:uncharacterized protein (DUF433 family)
MSAALRQVEELLPALSRAEKAQLLRLVAQDLDDSSPGIDSSPGVCGGEPCIVRTRVPVWVLEQSRRLGMSEEELLRSYPTLRAEDLVNAWAYVRSHRTEIEDQFRGNESA